MKKIYTLSLFFISVYALGQQNIYDLPKEINTTKTISHVNIPGTHIFIIPQKNFKVNGVYLPGLYDTTNNQVFIVAYENQDNIYKHFTTVNPLTSPYFKILYSENFKIQGYPAEINFTKPDSETVAGTLLFGDSTFAVKLTIFIPFGDSTSTNQILESLKTIYYDKDFTPNRYANAVFTVNDSASIYKFLETKQTVYIFSKGGRKADINNDYDSYIQVLQIPDETSAKEEVDELLEGLTDSVLPKAFYISNPKVERHYSSINNIPCYEVKVRGRDKDKNVFLYLQAFTIEEMVVLFEGLTYSDFDNFVAEFQKLSNTIRKNNTSIKAR